MNLADQLRLARSFLDTPEKWTQDAIARTARGYQCDALSVGACQFCSIGATLRASPVDGGVLLDLCLDIAARKLGFNSTTFLNDNADHATVLRMFDLAIEAAEVKEAA